MNLKNTPKKELLYCRPKYYKSRESKASSYLIWRLLDIDIDVWADAHNELVVEIDLKYPRQTYQFNYATQELERTFIGV